MNFRLPRLPLVFAFALAVSANAFAITHDELLNAIKQTRNETVLAYNQLSTGFKSLSALRKQTEGDLRPSFEAFKAGLAGAATSKEQATASLAKLNESTQTYFANWQADIQKLTNEDLRKQGTARMDQRRGQWSTLYMDLDTTLKQFDPVVRKLKEIEVALSYDLTEQGLRAVRDPLDLASESYEKLQEKLSNVTSNLDKFIAEISPVAK